MIFVDTNPPVKSQQDTAVEKDDGSTVLVKILFSQFNLDRLTGALKFDELLIFSEGNSAKFTANGKCSKLDKKKKLF